MIRTQLQMLLNAEKHFSSPIELCGNPWVRMKRGFERPAELGQVFDDRDVIRVIRRERPLIGQRPAAEKFFRVTRHRYFVAIGMMDFIALAAAGAASIICCCCCCC